MKAVKTVVPCLSLYLVYGPDADLGWAMILCVAPGVRPAVRASVVAISTKEPAYRKKVPVKKAALSNLDYPIERYLAEVV